MAARCARAGRFGGRPAARAQVKVVTDRHGRALYFSRAPIPWARPPPAGGGAAPPEWALRHVGMYAYRCVRAAGAEARAEESGGVGGEGVGNAPMRMME